MGQREGAGHGLQFLSLPLAELDGNGRATDGQGTTPPSMDGLLPYLMEPFSRTLQ